MSSVSTTTMMAVRHPSEKVMPPDHGAAGFTAVNGRESLTNGTSSSSSSRPVSGGKAASDTADRREHHVGNQSTSRQHSPRPGPDRVLKEMPNGNQQYSPPHEIDSPVSSPGKRKRTLTDEAGGSSGSSPYDLSPPRPASGSPAGLVDPRSQRQHEGDGNHAAYLNGTNGADPRNVRIHDTAWTAERPGPPHGYQSNGAGHHMETSDAQLAEALQRETHAQPSHRSWSAGGHPEDDAADQYGAYGADRSSQGAVQAGPKRKRVFSNRTKTGCMTCRKRKKKCDEGHPYCNNCLRGGFTCEGYNTRTTWQKQSNAKGPVPLQSKDGYVEGSEPMYPPDGHSPRTQRDVIPFDGPPQMRPIVVGEGDDATHYVTSPTSAGPGHRNPFPQPWVRNPSYVPDQSRQDLPPFSEIAREPAKQPAYAVPPIREYSHQHNTSHQSSSSWAAHGPDYRQSYTPSSASTARPPVDPRSLQVTAREGLSMEETQRTMIKGDELQKERMLSGQLFKYMDPLLVEDRKRCKIALKQFHDADNPTMGVAETERVRKLREVVNPSRNPLTNMPYTIKWVPHGAIGPGSIVETPFRCQYGYNITIDEDVYIGENCTIIDACNVHIGAKTWIGQNVQIITAMAHTSMNMRAGSGASWQGKAVNIAEDVHIGAGAIIYPGVTIKRGAQVEPGAVVKKDVESYAQGATLDFMM